MSAEDDLRAENRMLRQGLWDTWAALGHDTDGDTGPGAWIAGSGLESFIGMVVRDAARWRKESEDDYDADTSRLEAALAVALGQVAELRRILMQGGQDAASVRREAIAALTAPTGGDRA